MYYLIGIKGSGMAALANLLHSKGEEVKGADKGSYINEHLNPLIEVLDLKDINYHKDYHYIIGNAFKDSSEFIKIKDEGYKFSYYYDFINNYFLDKIKLGVSGSHGKTTICKYVAELMPSITYLIGDSEGKWTTSPYFVFEACEYHETFLNYNFDYLLINNIDYDHVDYFKNANDYFLAFQKACYNSKCLIINGDYPNLKALKHPNILSFGFAFSNDLVYDGNFIYYQNNKYKLKLDYSSKEEAYNILGAILLATLISQDANKVLKRVKKLKRPYYRLELIKKINGNYLFKDYAHHPKQINYSLTYLRHNYPNKKLVIIYEPHSISRFNYFYEEIITSLKKADEVFVSKVYDARGEKAKVKLLPFKPLKEFNIHNYKDAVICLMSAGEVLHYFY